MYVEMIHCGETDKMMKISGKMEKSNTNTSFEVIFLLFQELPQI